MPTVTVRREDIAAEAARRLAERKAKARGITQQRSSEDQQLWENCKTDLALFATEFFPHMCTTAFSVMHQEMFAWEANHLGERNVREATAAPRGSAKTTIRGYIKIIHDCVYQLERFIAIFSHTTTLATDRVQQIRDELENNQRLVEVYGPQVGQPWNNNNFITANFVRVRAASPGSQLRGVLQKGIRLSKIVLDDFENPEHVVSQLQRQKTSQRFFADIMKLGGPGTNVEVIGTVLHPQSLLAELLVNPGFSSRKYQAVLQFADAGAIPLWQQWRTMFVDLSNPHHQQDAHDFFEEHEEAMLRDSRVLWPERESYYDLMVMRVVEGESAFWLEKMNEPRGDSRYLFNMEDAAYCSITPLGIIRAGGTLVPWVDIVEVGMALDPTPDKKDVVGSDYASCPVIAEDRFGYLYVLDCYIAQEPSTKKQIDAIVDLLWKWDVHLLGVESNNFASLLVGDMREAIAQRAIDEATSDFEVQIVAIVNTRNKIARIKTLEPRIENGWLQFNRTLPGEYIEQLKNFLPVEGAGHDDGPDSTELAIRTVKHHWEKRDFS